MSCFQVSVCLRDESGRELPGILNQPSLTITAVFSGTIFTCLHRPLKCSAIYCLQVTTFLRLIGLESPVFTHVNKLLLLFGLLPTKISDRFGVTMSSVTRCLRRVTKALVDVRGDLIHWPRGRKLFLLNIFLSISSSKQNKKC